MARPSKFSDEEILAAAEKLAAAGKQITGYALSVELGGGRPSSFDERYAELTASKEPAPVLPALPTDVAAVIAQVTGEVGERLTAALTSAHALLKAQSHARIDEVEQAAEKQRLSAKAELDDAADRLGALQDELDQARAALGAANETIQVLKIDLSKHVGAAEEAARQLDQVKRELNERSSELQASQKEAAALSAQLVQAQSERDAARKAEVLAAEARNAAQLDAAAANAKLEQTTTQLVSLQATHNAIQQKAGGLEAELQATANECKKLKETNALALKSTQAAEKQVFEKHSQLSKLEGAHSQLQAELVELKKQLKESSSR